MTIRVSLRTNPLCHPELVEGSQEMFRQALLLANLLNMTENKDSENKKSLHPKSL